MITSFFGPSFTGRAAPQFVSLHRPEQITAPPAKVAVVSPPNGVVNQQLDVYLSWGKPSMALRYDVYFGSTAGTIALVSEDQAARAYGPTGLALDSTYYFRIDSVNDLGTTVGDVYSFSTWAAADIETDELGNPLTDERGRYLETFAANQLLAPYWSDKSLFTDTYSFEA